MQGKIPQPTAVPIAPPAPLMPGANATLKQTASGGLLQTEQNLQSVAGGADMKSLFQAITDAQQQSDKFALAQIRNSMGASGMGVSSDAMKQIAQYQLQSNQNTAIEIGKLGIQEQGIRTQAAQAQEELYGNAAMAYAPTQVVAGGGSAGPSPFSQISSAATGGATAIAAIMMAMAMCWIAEALFGPTFKAEMVRWWINSHAPRWITKPYRRYGQRVAAWIKRHPLVGRIVFQPLFEALFVIACVKEDVCRSLQNYKAIRQQ